MVLFFGLVFPLASLEIFLPAPFPLKPRSSAIFRFGSTTLRAASVLIY